MRRKTPGKKKMTTATTKKKATPPAPPEEPEFMHKRQVWTRLPDAWLGANGLLMKEAARNSRKVAGEIAVLVEEALRARFLARGESADQLTAGK